MIKKSPLKNSMYNHRFLRNLEQENFEKTKKFIRNTFEMQQF